MHVLAVILLSAVFLGLNALLWCYRPSQDVWLSASLFLGIVWGALFMRLITKGSAQ
jgi:hypothetical protein